MEITTTPLAMAETEAEPDCLHWLPGALDHEPETAWCIRHGDELPCATCQAAKRKERA